MTSLRTLLAFAVCGGVVAFPILWLVGAALTVTRVNRQAHETTRKALVECDGVHVPDVSYRISTFGGVRWGFADLYVVPNGVLMASRDRPFAQYVRAGSNQSRMPGVWGVREVNVVYEDGEDLRLVCSMKLFDMKIVLRGLPAEARDAVRSVLAGGA